MSLVDVMAHPHHGKCQHHFHFPHLTATHSFTDLTRASTSKVTAPSKDSVTSIACLSSLSFAVGNISFKLRKPLENLAVSGSAFTMHDVEFSSDTLTLMSWSSTMIESRDVHVNVLLELRANCSEEPFVWVEEPAWANDSITDICLKWLSSPGPESPSLSLLPSCCSWS